jgi:hypothetical protein
VVSHKAHKKDPTIVVSSLKKLREKPETSKDATTEVAKSPASPTPFTEIKFPAGSPKTIWTGRNGTFNSLGVELERKSGTDICAIVPQGKRGTAKNAIIEFPVSAIPQIVDFLTKQYIETLPK